VVGKLVEVDTVVDRKVVLELLVEEQLDLVN